MKKAGALALFATFALSASLTVSGVSAQSETATADDGAPVSEAPVETAPAPNVPLGANLTPPLGSLPGQALIPAPGIGRSGSSNVSMAPGTLTTGVITEGVNAVRAPETVPETAPVAVSEPAPEYVPEATEPVVDEAVVSDSAVATATDLDGDNYPDAAEWELGLDPTNIDTDGDGVADGDEPNIYGTDPTVFDSDGDGLSDGAELYDSRTDPLVWDDFSAPAAETTEPVAVETTETSQPVMDESVTSTDSEALAQETTENVTATDGDAAARGPGNASAAPGTVTRDGSSGLSLLGPDGTYRVSETSPPNVSISGNGSVTGDVEVIAPPAAPVAETTTSSTVSCGSYGSWYDAQVDYEAAGLTAGDPALVATLDPDYDGIACEEGM